MHEGAMDNQILYIHKNQKFPVKENSINLTSIKQEVKQKSLHYFSILIRENWNLFPVYILTWKGNGKKVPVIVMLEAHLI
jgi:hypothetical protein